MALTIEDGTGIAGADSYISVADAGVIAANFGWALPSDETTAEVALRNGAAYCDAFESRFAGYRLSDAQGLAWPRVNAYKCYGDNQIAIASSVVPAEMIKAQVAAAVQYAAGLDPRPNDSGQSIQENKVGPITRKYFDTGVTGGGFSITSAIDAMAPILCVGSSGILNVRASRA